MTVLVTLGNTIGVAMTLPFVNETRPLGWLVSCSSRGSGLIYTPSHADSQIPVSIQFLPALGIILMVPFCPESPRWLVGKGRSEEALISLNKLRSKEDIDSGLTAVEIEEIVYAVEQSKESEKGRWIDLFNRTYRYRTFIVVSLFFFYEVSCTVTPTTNS